MPLKLPKFFPLYTLPRSLAVWLLATCVACSDPEIAAAVAVTADAVQDSAVFDLQTFDVPVSSDHAVDSAKEVTTAQAPDAAACVPQCDGLLAQPKGKSQFPLVLVHGMGGFTNVGLLDYFFGIPKNLRDNGFAVFVTLTDPFNSSAVRAKQLAKQVDAILACTCAAKVNLVGHSQGGIDVRELVSALGYGDRVGSITTISTPHRGSKVADQLLGYLPGKDAGLLDSFAQIAGKIYTKPEADANVKAALEQCSEKLSAAWNAAHPDDPRVAYYSWAGYSGLTANGKPACEGGDAPVPAHGDIVEPGLLASWLAVGGAQIPNDGLVTVESAKWGHFRGCVPADHMDEVGQLAGIVDGFDYLKFYRDLAQYLVGKNL